MKNSIRKIATCIIIGIPFFAFSQSESPSIISLSGEASKKVTPDIAVVNFDITSSEKLENEALSKLNENTNNLITKITSAGFSKNELKITGYSIREDISYNGGKPKRVGYIAHQNLVLKFKYDKEKLTMLFGKFSDEKSENISFGFAYEISDERQKETKNNLIKAALKDAEEKANIIAQSSGLKIKSIKEIDYAAGNVIHPALRALGAMREMSGDANSSPDSFSSIDVKEIGMRETIRVAYIVENIK